MASNKPGQQHLYAPELEAVNVHVHSEDLIQRMIRSEIEVYRVKSFQNFTKDLYVFPSRRAQEVHAKDGRFIGWDRYVFQGKGLEKPMHVRLRHHERPAKVKLRTQEGWRSIACVLQKLRPDCDFSNFSDSHRARARSWMVRMQSDWWAVNMKTFKFLNLPQEIREIVYGFAFGDLVEPYPSMRCRRLTKGSVTHQELVDRQPNMALLRLNKETAHEARHYLYLYKPFVVKHKPVLSRLLTSSVLSLLRQLDLSLTMDGYFQLFGYHFGTGKEVHTKAPSRTAIMFREMRLNSLTINIPPPSQLHDRAWLDDACHAKIVDCLFEAAWPFIRGHPSTFTGFIKTRQVQRFTNVCQAEHQLAKSMLPHALTLDSVQEEYLLAYDEYLWLQNEDGEDGGIRLDDEISRKPTPWGVNVMKSIKSMPIECECDVPCCLENWKSDA